jgi:hypothetical protein
VLDPAVKSSSTSPVESTRNTIKRNNISFNDKGDNNDDNDNGEKNDNNSYASQKSVISGKVHGTRMSSAPGGISVPFVG